MTKLNLLNLRFKGKTSNYWSKRFKWLVPIGFTFPQYVSARIQPHTTHTFRTRASHRPPNHCTSANHLHAHLFEDALKDHHTPRSCSSAKTSRPPASPIPACSAFPPRSSCATQVKETAQYSSIHWNTHAFFLRTPPKSKLFKGYDGLDGVELVVHGRRGARQMVNLVHLQQQRLHDVVADELEARIAEVVLHILLAAREEIVHHDHAVAALHQPVHQVAAHEPGAARHHDPERLPLQPQRDLAPAEPNGLSGLLPSVGRGILKRRRVQSFSGDNIAGNGGIGVAPREAKLGLQEQKEDRGNGHAYQDEREALLAQHVLPPTWRAPIASGAWASTSRSRPKPPPGGGSGWPRSSCSGAPNKPWWKLDGSAESLMGFRLPRGSQWSNSERRWEDARQIVLTDGLGGLRKGKARRNGDVTHVPTHSDVKNADLRSVFSEHLPPAGGALFSLRHRHSHWFFSLLSFLRFFFFFFVFFFSFFHFPNLQIKNHTGIRSSHFRRVLNWQNNMVDL